VGDASSRVTLVEVSEDTKLTLEMSDEIVSIPRHLEPSLVFRDDTHEESLYQPFRLEEPPSSTGAQSLLNTDAPE
jgi:hypothetical protein